jgi:hypothetical protein
MWFIIIIVVTVVVTYSMEQSPSWEAKRFAASQEIPSILWNPKINYRLHIIIIIIIISFMQGICTYILETNNVPREYVVAAVLLLLFMVPISLVPPLALLYFYVSTFRSLLSVKYY